jgi:hypothetical protein
MQVSNIVIRNLLLNNKSHLEVLSDNSVSLMNICGGDGSPGLMRGLNAVPQTMSFLQHAFLTALNPVGGALRKMG